MFFCKRECKPEDILIKTTGVRDQRGRYSITYEGGENVVVSITQLTKSDSGLYRCGLGGSNITFEIIVVDALQDGNTGLTNAQIPSVYTGTEGGDVEVRCPFSSYGTSMFFCKRECKPEDILIHTTGVRDQRGRYSIRYDGGGNVFVSITQLTKSDSGLYRCGLGGSNITFEIIVVDGWASTSTSMLLYAVLIPVIIVILSGLTLMIICIQRNTKPKGLQTRGNSDGTNMEVTFFNSLITLSVG
ncbi:polymeric immunoglobulin receptor-like isoform X2 [Micropterus salmoides]|uniref:polymeric immunoglobulin receptor-like isoform X2 n=1 Tax=Micropterus salmoides TaxID=27706 RepID=UPI0018EDEEFB|nr:polymeric immunoglobulin receptor-like isoform X2 [Micropterus salmoides]